MNKIYLDYFRCNCYPKDIRPCVVKSIESNVRNHLNRLGLGSRLVDHNGIRGLIEMIFKCQGIIVNGSKDMILKSITNDVKSMISSK